VSIVPEPSIVVGLDGTEALEARMLVLGHARWQRRTGREDYGYGGAPALGSIARACVARAECPVVMVPEPAVSRTPVRAEELEHHVPMRGVRAIYSFQGRIPVAHQ
jgi:hypothetical protein